MTTEREYLTTILADLTKIRTDVFHAAFSLHQAGYPDASHDLLAVYQSLSAVYGQVNRLTAGTPADRRHL